MPHLKAVLKTPTGIGGLDQVTHGGLPAGRTTLVIGGPGCGKTVLGLQFLVNGAREYKEPGIFVAFEEDSRELIANAATFGWDLPELAPEQLFFLDAQLSPDDAIDGEFDLAGMLAIITARAKAMGARRIVFDAIDALLNQMGNALARRRELHRLRRWLADSGLTGILTSTAGEVLYVESSNDSVLQYLSDVVISLSHRLEEQVSQRRLRVVKYRGSGFAENEVPLLIGPRGMDIACPRLDMDIGEVHTDRVSTGVAELDAMLTGGYLRGTSVLLSGYPGTAKSTLAGAFIDAACKRGEKALYVTFDEKEGEIVRNLSSVGLNLQQHLTSGLLRIHSAHSEAQSAEEHRLVLEAILDEHRPAGLVIDPISALLNAGGEISSMAVAQRLIGLAKHRGITVACTSLTQGEHGLTENSQMAISTIADTWIHVSYVVRGGERNRALTIIKSRGTGHSNQVRELVLSDDGITLTDLYTAGGEVLMGTLRWEKQAEVETDHIIQRAEVERQRIALELENAQANLRIELLRLDVEGRRRHLEAIARQETAREHAWTERERQFQRLRSGESVPTSAAPENA